MFMTRVARSLTPIVGAAFVFALATTAACSSEAPPEEKARSGSQLTRDDGDEGGGRSCTCRVTTNYTSRDFYDSESDCENEVNGKGQGTHTFTGSCAQDRSFLFGYIREERPFPHCSGVEFQVKCE